AAHLPGLPDGHELTSSGTAKHKPTPDRYVFLHCRCVKSSAFFLARYVKDETTRPPSYRAVATHRLDDFDFAPGRESPSVSTALLQEPKPCPDCGNPCMAGCADGHLHCCPASFGGITLICPWCKVPGVYGAHGAFDVGAGAG